MTDPFMRVDVSQTSRDFQPVALEPGLALLDRSNTNGQILRHWFGEFVAEPDRVGDRVGFYVRDDQSRRIDSVFCQPVTEKDLRGELAKDFQELERRNDAVRPQSPNEQLIHKVVGDQLRNLADEHHSRERRTCLFKFRDGRNKWRMVWAPGYKRRDNEPATTQVCSNPKCKHLFLQRPETGAKCPICQVIRKPLSNGRESRGLTATLLRVVLLILLLAIGIGGTIWWQNQHTAIESQEANSTVNSPLTVEPSSWSGPVGSQVQFVIRRHEGEATEIVTAEAAVSVGNPKVLSVKPFENRGKALSPGTTELTFFVGTLKVQATVTVEPRTRPTKLFVQPDKLELGVGTTAQVWLIGEFGDGNQVDLTDDAEWDSNQDAKFFVQKGRIEGEEPGTGTLHVRYRFDESEPPDEASVQIVVRDYRYKDLKLKVEPSLLSTSSAWSGDQRTTRSLIMGRPARLHATVVAEDGSEFAVDESKDLVVDVDPPELGRVQGSGLSFTGEGNVTITAQFRGLTSSLDLKVAKGDESPQSLEVSPKNLELKVGEMARLSIVSAHPLNVRVSSTDPMIADVNSSGEIIGKGVGSARIQVSDGGEPVTIDATVSVAQWQSILIEPVRISIRPQETATVRVYGLDDQSNQVELASDQLTWVALPRPEFVDFDKSKMLLTGQKPTGDHPEQLVVQFNTFSASADVEIVAAPMVLTLLPADSVEIPVGQKRKLSVRMQSGGLAPVEVPADDVEWIISPQTNLAIKNGEIAAMNEGDQVRVAARYQGVTSNEVRVTFVAATPLTLHAEAVPHSLAPGAVGNVEVTASGPGGPVDLDQDELVFASAAPEIVQVESTTGAYRAMSPGQATIRVSHPSAKQNVEVQVSVVDAPAHEVVASPASLRLVTGQGNSIKLPVGAEFSDWTVESVGQDGCVTNVTDKATLVIEGDPRKASVVISNRRIVAVQQGRANVHALFGGIRTSTGLQVEVVEGLDVDEIRIRPVEINLIAGESSNLAAEGFKAGKSVGGISHRSELVWKSGNVDLVGTNGAQVDGKKPGSTTVTASFGSVISNPCKINVFEADQFGNAPVQVGGLEVVPSRLRMKTGQVAKLGHEIIVKRQATDFSDTCEVAVPESRIVAYDAPSRTIKALSPGHVQLTLIVRDQSATFDVDVEPEIIPSADSSIVIEPNSGQIAIGEELALRVFVVTPDGARSPVTAAFSSSDPNVAVMTGSSLQSVAAGEVTVEARVSGIRQVGKAVFTVGDVDFERLVVNPSPIRIAVGERKPFEVFGVTKNGRVKLGHDPNLKFEIEAPDGHKETFPNAHLFEMVGLHPCKVTLIATWKGRLEQRVPVTVEEGHFGELVIKPDAISISEGESVNYQVFARRKGRLQPLKPADGIELIVADPVIATKSNMQVTGLKAGKTQVVAKYGEDRTISLLTVIPRSRPIAPAAAVERLRFVDDVAQIELGDPGSPIRVVRVLADGTEQLVDQGVTFTVREPGDVIAIESTNDGSLIRPKNAGQTEVDATLDNLHTQKPLLVVVNPATSRKPKMRLSPEILRIPVGQTSTFAKAEIVLASGSAPVSVPFKLTTPDNQIIEIASDNSIRGLKPGTAVVTATADDKEGKYQGMTALATVEVVDSSRDATRHITTYVENSTGGTHPGNLSSGSGKTLPKVDEKGAKSGSKDSKAGDKGGKTGDKGSKIAQKNHESGKGPGMGGRGGQSGGGGGTAGLGGAKQAIRPELVLQGPSETNVDAEIPMDVELVLGRQSTDVTRESELILSAGDERLAEVRPGGVIRAKSPGRIHVQAKYNDLTSAVREIQIRPIATFERLELAVSRRQFAVDEVVDYQLWGIPRDGGARQDLTLLVTDDESKPGAPRIRIKTLAPNGGSIVAHQPGSLTGKQPGRFSMQAQIGDKLTSSIVNLQVIGDSPVPDRIRVEPSRIEVFAGTETPPIRVQSVSATDRTARTIDPELVTLTDAGTEILTRKGNGIFQAVKPGETQINVSYQGMTQSIPVTVKFNPFSVIEVGTEPKFANSTMTVDLVVKAQAPPGDLEYSVKLPRINDRPVEETPWVKADRAGDEVIAKLRTPKIPIGNASNQYYSIVIEARDVRTGKIERRPYSFRLVSESGSSKSVD